MASNSKKKKLIPQTGELPRSFLRKIVAAYTFLMLFIYPLYYQNKYYNMGEAKWIFFKNVSAFFAVVFIAVFIWYIASFVVKKEIKEFLISACKKLTVLDCFVLAYLAVAVLSTIITPYKENVIFGYNGWYMGLIAQVGFVFIYLAMSRFMRWDGVGLIAYMCTAALVFYFGVIMRFRIDPMEMYIGLEEHYIKNFLSTLGQATWYSSYMTIIYPIILIAYWHYDKKWQKILFGAFSSLSFMTVVTQNSDSAYIAILAVFFMLFWISFESNKDFLRVLELLTIAFASFIFIGVLQVKFAERAVPLDELSIYMSQSDFTKIALAVVVILYVLCRFLDKKEKLNIEKFRFIRVIGLIAGIACAIGAVVFVYLNSTGQLPEQYAADNNYLYFNDNWGNNRGISWRVAVQTIQQCELPRKLFGAGPDGFAQMVYVYFGEELRSFWGESTTLTCCHNEWLNMFVNLGFIGGIIYLGIFVTAFFHFMKRGKEYPQLYAVAISIIAYFCHNFFCYQQIICTPIIFLLMGYAEALSRNGYELEEE